MSEPTVNVEQREAGGTNAARRLRAQGLVPAVVYGAGKDAVTIQVDRRSVLNLLNSAQGENTIFLLKMAESDAERHTMIRDLQVDPVTREIVHIDFQRVNLKEAVKVQIPIELEGVPVGVKTDGGILDFVTREVEVECLPTDIPAHLTIDVSGLHIGDHLEASNLTLPKDVTLLEEENRVIVSIAAPRLAEEEEDEDEGLLEHVADEPEVIGRGKDDGDDEDEEGS